MAFGDSFRGDPERIIFKAAVNNDTSRLVIFEDCHGVIDTIMRLGLITPPSTFGSEEEQYAYWREIITKVEIEWDGSELLPDSQVRLSYPSDEGISVELSDWRKPSRLRLDLERLLVPAAELV